MIKHISAAAILWCALAVFTPVSAQQKTYSDTDQNPKRNAAKNQIPDLKFKDEKGNTVSLHSLKGKVVFINLWATWCPPCIQEMPSIDKLREKFKDNENLVFVMADVDGNMQKAKAFMDKKKLNLPVHIFDGSIPSELFSGSIPTTILVDKDSSIVGRQVGGADYASEEFVDLMAKLLAQ